MQGNLSWVEINRSALVQNISQIRKIIPPPVKLMAVVKANAYGHGLGIVGKIIKNKVDWFGVNNLEEAKQLRDLGVKIPILILGYTLPDQLREVVINDFRQVIYNQQTVEDLVKCLGNNHGKKVKVHLKIETGANRQGIGESDILDFVKLAQKHPDIEVEGVYTHFANLEDTQDSNFTQKQLANFKRIVSLLEKNNLHIPVKHTACTAAILLFKETYFNLVRLGIGLYGLWPSQKIKIKAREIGLKLDLSPVLTWKTRVVQVKKVKKGEKVGYGCTFSAKSDLKIAILPVGYFDGYDLKLSNSGEVLIHGQRAPVTGRICMNMMMVDVSKIPQVKLDDEVVLIGKQGVEEMTAEELAEKIGTINYEVVSRINSQISRVVV